ncbi:phosphogluconate dehydrogenase (NAD(+)-dependent, decarboxylating) [Piscinibacter sp.]|uniref:phosphogluconate dehydrogenase (NAD(+)-dependent, decarboxylating) n=1 Tax=Piscinibacter sp. TaxID=1903157 RepID=UPI002C6DF59E|nr:decarboxylating 6-phosphogluconate dehydrogenase [Albitalea sp.]HUG22930.1 decarboxylating 6-phosphogluconate dehydrogenase [Albitalea sp.]
MQLGMIGLGRMGASMVRRLLRDGHACVVHDLRPSALAGLVKDGATGAASLKEIVSRLGRPRAIWLMVPAAVVDQALGDLLPSLDVGDIVVDGGNSYYRDDMRRGTQLQTRGIHYLDVGTSGGVAGLERGYCLMIGGESGVVEHLRPIFSSLAPGIEAATRTPGRKAGTGTAEEGFLHCGPHGAGHFVKMVHNGIEYGVMAAYAEGLNILRGANLGQRDPQAQSGHDAETTPLRDPELYRFEMNLPEITEVWRRGSVIGSWLLDLTATALVKDPELAGYGGRVSDSGEGRWTIQAAIDEGVPVPVLSAALFERFASRGNAAFANRILSAMRYEFGGHAEKPAS